MIHCLGTHTGSAAGEPHHLSAPVLSPAISACAHGPGILSALTRPGEKRKKEKDDREREVKKNGLSKKRKAGFYTHTHTGR